MKWVETRGENLMVAGHAREETLELDAAVDADGRVRGLRVRMQLDAGAYPMLPFPASFFSTLVAMLLPNAYRIEAYSFESTVMYTSKASYISYRGPWAVETWVREAILDAVGRELGITPEEIRRRNLFSPEHLPAHTTTGISLSNITARETLERAVELMDLDAFRAAQATARAEGRWLGLGFATFIEIAPGPPDFAKLVGFDLPSETAWARLEPTGHVTVSTWQVSQGQSHETTLAQVVADEMGVPIEMVRIVAGDSATTPWNTMSTGGSRASTMASGAAVGATRMVKDMVLAIAANMLEANEADLEIDDSTISVRGTPTKSVELVDVARRRVVRAVDAARRAPPGTRSDVRLQGAAHRRMDRRHPLLLGGGRPRDRQHRDPALPRRRGLRHPHQPGGRRRPDHRRRDAGHRADPLRASRLRRRRQPAHVVVRRLPRARRRPTSRRSRSSTWSSSRSTRSTRAASAKAA